MFQLRRYTSIKFERLINCRRKKGCVSINDNLHGFYFKAAFRGNKWSEKLFFDSDTKGKKCKRFHVRAKFMIIFEAHVKFTLKVLTFTRFSINNIENIYLPSSTWLNNSGSSFSRRLFKSFSILLFVKKERKELFNFS